MRRVLAMGVLCGVSAVAAGGWSSHAWPEWERALMRSPETQVNGQAYRMQQQVSRLTLADFSTDAVPAWVRAAHRQVLPTGLLLSGRTQVFHWVLKVVPLDAGTQWSWAAWPRRSQVRPATTPDWMPTGGVLMFSSRDVSTGRLVLQQSHRFQRELTGLREVFASSLVARGWTLLEHSGEHQRWQHDAAELDLLFHRVRGSSAVFFTARFEVGAASGGGHP